LDYRKLATINGLRADDTLRPGQKLHLTTEPKEQPDRTLSYQVRPGDSLYVIARRFGVDITDLKRWNRIGGSRLQPGQTLTLYLPLTTASRL
jgi:membrane-bound lytic murein transglycosylase D